MGCVQLWTTIVHGFPGMQWVALPESWSAKLLMVRIRSAGMHRDTDGTTDARIRAEWDKRERWSFVLGTGHYFLVEQFLLQGYFFLCRSGGVSRCIDARHDRFVSLQYASSVSLADFRSASRVYSRLSFPVLGAR